MITKRTIYWALFILLVIGLWWSAFGADYSGRVRNAQAELAKQGYRIDVDGFMGDKTRRVIRDYQRNHDLDVTGELDRATIGKLFGAPEYPPVADDYLPVKPGPQATCKPGVIDEVSKAMYLQTLASSDVRAQWARKAQLLYGEIYSDPANAHVVKSDCIRLAVGVIRKYRCHYVAYPCKAPE